MVAGITEIDWLRQLYIEDLGKIVCYDGYNKRPRVRRIEQWEALDTVIKGTPMDLTDKLDRVHVWADQHFFHKNIITFRERPFMNVDEMNELYAAPIHGGGSARKLYCPLPEFEDVDWVFS